MLPGCFDAYKYTVIQSIVDCLSNLLPLSHKFETARMLGNTVHRTQAERDALELLHVFLLRFGVQIGLECNIFSLWLEEYPFGGDLELLLPGDKDSQLAAKQEHITQLSLRQGNDIALSRIINLIITDKRAYETMCQRKLLGPPNSEGRDKGTNDDEDRVSRVWYEVHGTAIAPDPGLGPMMRRGHRVRREESIEEQALRRRRREAMVLGEMGRPIESEDIIQRVNT
ncbi:MAG: hypothetical protein Q9166_004477 [cf. Caloplaca sp. 2 TL-2023]